MDAQIINLSPSCTHIHVPIADKKSATVLILVGVGSRYETPTNNGIAHFIEHMLFKGTQNRPTAIQISEEIDSLGADYNAFTSKEYTGFYIKTASSSIHKGIEILADMLKNSLFDEQEIEKEKSVIVEEINMYNDTPMRQIGTIFEDLVYSPHALSYDTAGKRETVISFTGQQLQDFKKQWYDQGRVVIVTSGGVQDDTVSYIKDHFGYLSSTPISNNFRPFINNQNSPLVHIRTKQSDQAHFCLGLRSFEIGNQNRYAMSVLNTIMGGNMSSRFFVELREKRGLCYYVSSDNDAYLDTGMWVIQAGVDTQRVPESLTACLEELVKLREFGITISELQKAKQYLKGRLALGLEDSKGIANLFGINMLLESKIRLPSEIEQGIEAVAQEDVNQLAKLLIQARSSSYAMIGPIDQSQQSQLYNIIDKTLA